MSKWIQEKHDNWYKEFSHCIAMARVNKQGKWIAYAKSKLCLTVREMILYPVECKSEKAAKDFAAKDADKIEMLANIIDEHFMRLNQGLD